MTRLRLELADTDVAVLAGVMDVDAAELRGEIAARPWVLNDVLRNPDVASAVLATPDGDDPAALEIVSPLLFFAVIVHRAAAELEQTEWVAEWTGPKSRLPVFDVEPLLEFADDPGRLVFVANLLVGFAMPEPIPVPARRNDIDDLVRWLDAAEPHDRVLLLRRLGDLALFQAGVFPDANGAEPLDLDRAEHLARSLELSAEELLDRWDAASPTPGLDALEALGSGWYQAAAAGDRRAVPPVVLDVAARMRPARRFLNHLADHYLAGATPALGLGG